MRQSEIVIEFADDLLPSGLELLAGVSGVKVQLVYPQSQRAIAVLETETNEERVERLRSIQALPQVLAAGISRDFRHGTTPGRHLELV